MRRIRNIYKEIHNKKIKENQIYLKKINKMDKIKNNFKNLIILKIILKN